MICLFIVISLFTDISTEVSVLSWGTLGMGVEKKTELTYSQGTMGMGLKKQLTYLQPDSEYIIGDVSL